MSEQMTLRDQFALEALRAIPVSEFKGYARERGIPVNTAMAELCYGIADSLLAKRAEGSPK